MVRVKFMILRLVCDSLAAIILIRAYVMGIKLGVELTGINYWFTRIPLGVVGIGAALFLLEWVKKMFFFVVKSADIFSICTGETSVLKSFIGVHKKFIRTYSIGAFNSILRNIINNLLDKLKSNDSVNGILEQIDSSFFIKLPVFILKTATDYLDECVLGYIYTHPETKISASVLKTFDIFIRNSSKVFARVCTITIMQFLLKVIYFIAFFVIYVTHFRINFMSLAIGYLTVCCTWFIILDSILEPLLMKVILKTFCECDESSDSELTDSIKEQILEALPELKDVIKFDKNKESDNHAE